MRGRVSSRRGSLKFRRPNSCGLQTFFSWSNLYQNRVAIAGVLAWKFADKITRIQLEIFIKKISHAELIKRPISDQLRIQRRIGIGEARSTCENLPVWQQVDVVAARRALPGVEVTKIYQRLAVGLCIPPQQGSFLSAIGEFMIDMGINVQTYAVRLHQFVDGRNHRQVLSRCYDINVNVEKLLELLDSFDKVFGADKLAMEAGV